LSTAKIRAVSVMGATRSGTSLTINLLNKLGFYVEDDHRPPDKFNEQGYGESERLRRINDKIFAIYKSGEIEPLLPPDWLEDPRIVQLHEEAKQLISDMNAHGEWAWKAPPLTLTFPFWEPFLPENHCCLICVRNPLATMKSGVAYGRTPEQAVISWFLRNLGAIRNTSKQRRYFVFYEDYFNSDSNQLQEIATFVGKGDKTANLVSTDLKHFDFTVKDVLQSDELTTDAKLLYLLLLQGKRNPEVFQMVSQVADENEDNPFNPAKVYDLKRQLEYYKRISNHPYVKFGLRVDSLLRKLRGRTKSQKDNAFQKTSQKEITAPGAT
jgi:hypothetical protein